MYFDVCPCITNYLYAAQGRNRPEGQIYCIFLMPNCRELFGYSDNFTPLAFNPVNNMRKHWRGYESYDEDAKGENLQLFGNKEVAGWSVCVGSANSTPNEVSGRRGD